MVAFRVLGPVEAYAHDDELDLGGLRQRAVLARLLVARGQVVPVDTLLYDLWDDDTAKGAQSGLQVYISRLRRVLEPGRPRGGPNRLLVTVASGYALRVAPDQVDALRFEQLVRAAGEHLEEGDPQSARGRLEKSLGLWRGTPYSDFADQTWAEAEVNRLAELRLVARERHADTGLRLGLPSETVPDLEALTTEHPLREEGWRLLALGLYRCGRQGDALAALRRARGILADELGIDPGPALRKLESDILAQSPELDLTPPPRPSRPVPAADTWPPRPATPVEPPPLEPEPFVGRDAELSRLTTAAARTGRFQVAIVTGVASCQQDHAAPPAPGQAHRRRLDDLVGRLPRLQRHPARLGLGGDPAHAGPRDRRGRVRPVTRAAARRRRPPDPDDDEVSGGFRLHRAVGGYLAGVASRSPVLLTLEDLHWADDQTLALLRALPSLLATSRVLLVVTCRESELDDNQADVLAALARLGPLRVSLSGLDPKAVAQLVRATCVREIEDDAVESIVERTAGNPFFVRETVRLLDAEGAADRASAAEVLSQVPSGVRDVLRRRISRLPAGAQQILLQAAVIGRDVDVDVLVDVAERRGRGGRGGRGRAAGGAGDRAGSRHAPVRPRPGARHDLLRRLAAAPHPAARRRGGGDRAARPVRRGGAGPSLLPGRRRRQGGPLRRAGGRAGRAALRPPRGGHAVGAGHRRVRPHRRRHQAAPAAHAPPHQGAGAVRRHDGGPGAAARGDGRRAAARRPGADGPGGRVAGGAAQGHGPRLHPHRLGDRRHHRAGAVGAAGGRAVAARQPAHHAGAGAGGLLLARAGPPGVAGGAGGGPAERRPGADRGRAERAAAAVLRHPRGRHPREHRP
ncbi:BTAD domain-containing putative transcriptional regulator [Nonomuraea ferruginea]